MTNGINVNLYFLDGKANGIMKCSLLNWTGVGYKIPRTMLSEAKNIPLLEQTGVYFLFGEDDDGKSLVYVGQAGIRKNGRGVLCRLEEHLRNEKMEYWKDAVVFTTANDSLGATEISYLEHKFHDLVVKADRYKLINRAEPNIGNLTEEKRSELGMFVNRAKLVMVALGHKVFEKTLPKTEEGVALDFGSAEDFEYDKEPILYYKSGKHIDALGKRAPDGFVILKGSKISLRTSRSARKNILRYRDNYDDKITKDGVVLADLLFSSPSGAASFVAGGSRSGNAMWKDEKGISLGDLEKLQSEKS